MYDDPLVGKPEFIGQALVPLSDLAGDGQPMGFDLTLQQAGRRGNRSGADRAAKHSSASKASVALQLTYNPLS